MRTNEKVYTYSNLFYYFPLTPRLAEDPIPVSPQASLERENENLDENDEPGAKILSKKEKEKLKKEREKVGFLSPCYH
jgi:hypothetical protein